MLVLLTTVN